MRPDVRFEVIYKMHLLILISMFATAQVLHSVPSEGKFDGMSSQ